MLPGVKGRADKRAAAATSQKHTFLFHLRGLKADSFNVYLIKEGEQKFILTIEDLL